MKRYQRESWELDIGRKILSKDDNINRFKELINKSVNIMQSKAESEFNPQRYHLSDEARKRLKWMYIIKFECDNNISQAAKKIGISRQWLSKIHSTWEKLDRDPRSLEPESRAPNNTDNRKTISAEIKDKIVEARADHYWGKDKLITVLKNEYNIIVGASTINRHLNKKGLIDVKISNRIKMAHKNKVEQKQKFRPPKEIKDYKPGALIEKDMKFILKTGEFVNFEKHKAKENFWNQHTVIDSFTRIRTLGLAEDGNSNTAVMVQEECVKRLPFMIACANTDNGSENEKTLLII